MAHQARKSSGFGGLLLAAHGDEMAGLGPAVGRILAYRIEDRVAGIKLGQSVPKRVEFRIGNLGLSVVIKVLMLSYQALEFSDPCVVFPRHVADIVRRGDRRCQIGARRLTPQAFFP